MSDLRGVRWRRWRSLRATDRKLRVLLSEGSSTSAREAVTILGLQGHTVEICDPNPHCLARFSRFVAKFHCCPGLGIDPHGYTSFILDLVRSRKFDVLLPIHEQGLALSKVRDELVRHVAVALPAFESYERAFSKVGFSTVLSELGLTQPVTRIVETTHQIRSADRFPVVLKTSIGTASRGVWIVRSDAELQKLVDELELDGSLYDPILIQEWVDGALEQSQAIFDHGRLTAVHSYRHVLRGAGGGAAVKESVYRPQAGLDLGRIGGLLSWHGALSVDYLVPPGDKSLYYIDCNPRLVEPMSAWLADNDLLEILLRVTLGRPLPPLRAPLPGVRTHLAMQALIGCADRTQSRIELFRECWRLAFGGGIYRRSQEELTPIRSDWPSFIPLGSVIVWLALRPLAARELHRKGWGEHLLNSESVRRIRRGFDPKNGIEE